MTQLALPLQPDPRRSPLATMLAAVTVTDRETAELRATLLSLADDPCYEVLTLARFCHSATLRYGGSGHVESRLHLGLERYDKPGWSTALRLFGAVCGTTGELVAGTRLDLALCKRCLRVACTGGAARPLGAMSLEDVTRWRDGAAAGVLGYALTDLSQVGAMLEVAQHRQGRRR